MAARAAPPGPRRHTDRGRRRAVRLPGLAEPLLRRDRPDADGPAGDPGRPVPAPVPGRGDSRPAAPAALARLAADLRPVRPVGPGPERPLRDRDRRPRLPDRAPA